MNRHFISTAINVLLLAVVLGLSWSFVSTRSSLRDIETASEKLREQLEDAQAEIKRIRAEARPALTIETMDPSQLATSPGTVAKPKVPLSTVPKFVHVLRAGQTSVTGAAQGRIATIPFQPISSNRVEHATLVVRLAPKGTARIVRFAPVDSGAVENAVEHINPSGTFAVFQAEFQTAGELVLQLVVTEPAVAEISGNFEPGALTIDLQ